ncbi:MAG: IreB family regulatory phosphoprotein [Bacilli bacterium]
MDNDKTRLYSVENFDNMLVYDTLKDVYESLDERGYNPTNQIVGYLISGDPGYISNHKEARKKITRLDRNVIVEKLLKYYLENNK